LDKKYNSLQQKKNNKKNESEEAEGDGQKMGKKPGAC
jgi:hypothetical protein